MSKVIGIDLGTGNSCVAGIENGKPVVIANAEGKRTTPSVVCLKDGDVVVGDKAKRTMVMSPKHTVAFIKRLMGEEFNNNNVMRMVENVAYDIVNVDNKPVVRIKQNDETDRDYSPVEISSFIIAKMKKVAEDYYGEEVKDAVITVPAWFNNNQREATKLAGQLAGLNVLRVINEPTAAIVASNIDVTKKDKTIAVVDLGCGTLDISVCEVSGGDVPIIEVKASNGDTFLGGQDFDQELINLMVEEFNKVNADVIGDYDITKDTMAYSRIVEAAEKAKIELSGTLSTDVNIPYITSIGNNPVHFSMTITRAKYDAVTKHLVDKVISCTREALRLAKENGADDIDEILLVGGMTRSINIQTALSETFGVKLNQGAEKDEAVALGAAIQANVAAGNTNGEILLLDVTPLSLGIEVMGGVMEKLIPANTTIPTSKTQIFSTATDNQTAVTIHVLQGERPMANQNKSIGMFNLDGIAPARRGVPQIEVKFDIDVNGILSVSAKDLGTGKEQSVTIQSSNSLSQEEIDRIKEEAELHKAEDEKKAKDVKAINESEGYAYSVKNWIDDDANKSLVTDEEKSKLNTMIDDLLASAKENNVEKCQTLQKDIEGVFGPIVTKAYQSQQDANGNAFNGADFTQGGDFRDVFNNMFKNANAGATPSPDIHLNEDGGVEEADAEEVK